MLKKTIVGFSFTAFQLAIVTPTPAFEMDFPVQCELGKDCFVQNLVDLDSSPKTLDPFCGQATYNGHKGTDIRIKSIADMQKGVSVVAVADGTVVRTRNTVADRLAQTAADRAAVKNIACGNGLVIDHGAGWQSQYCHLKRGSIRPAPGDTISRGEVLGEIGLSGSTVFPHLHLAIRHDGKLVDPMTGQKFPRQKLKPCPDVPGLSGTSLWTGKARKNFSTDVSAILAAGFSTGPVKGTAILQGVKPPQPKTGSKAIVLWASLINLRVGDRVRYSLSGPADFRYDHAGEKIGRHKATWTAYAGKRLRVKSGTYRGWVSLVRKNRAVLKKQVQLTIP